MNRFAIFGILAVCLIAGEVEARHRLFRKHHSENCPCPCVEKIEGTCEHNELTTRKSQFWPFTNGDDEVPVDPVNPEPTPAPEPLPEPPVPSPTPEPTPAPVPDPAPLPPEPAPAPEHPVVIPTDHAELSTYVAGKLGGYNRANFQRNGITVDVYQARGKQRIVWTVADSKDWQTAFVNAFITKAATGANNAGLVLVCHCPDNPEPQPEPGPLPVPDTNDPVQKKLYKFGGMDLVSAEAVCRAAGLWLAIVHDRTGDVNRVIYGNVVQKKVKWTTPKKK